MPETTVPVIAIIEHQETCPPALVGEWLAEAGCQVALVRVWAGEDLLEPGQHGGLIILGGSMGANDDETVPWLAPTKALIRGAAMRRQPTLGICLGHQLMAAALGGRVEVNPFGQLIGRQQVSWTSAARTDPLLGRLARTLLPTEGVHWNNDTVTGVPDGAVVLAMDPRGDIQSVRYAPAMWGVQWHPEANDAVLQRWAELDAAKSGYVADPGPVLASIAADRAAIDHAARQLTETFVARVRAREHLDDHGSVQQWPRGSY